MSTEPASVPHAVLLACRIDSPALTAPTTPSLPEPKYILGDCTHAARISPGRTVNWLFCDNATELHVYPEMLWETVKLVVDPGTRLYVDPVDTRYTPNRAVEGTSVERL